MGYGPLAKIRLRPHLPEFATEVLRGWDELSTYHREWKDGFPQALQYRDFLAWLDEHEYEGDERAAAMMILRNQEGTWRKKTIEEIQARQSVT